MSRQRVKLGASIASYSGLVETMLLVGLCLSGWTLLPGTLVFGQTPASPDAKPPARARFRSPTIDQQVQRFGKSLDLDETQQAQVRKILAAQQLQSRRIHEDGSISGAERIARFRALQDWTITQIRSVLYDEQKKKYDPLGARQAQPTASQPSLEDWMKATANKNK